MNTYDLTLATPIPFIFCLFFFICGIVLGIIMKNDWDREDDKDGKK
jgi:preprotein translocase subunit SecG